MNDTTRAETNVMANATWFALGLLGGVAIALLTSPRTGRENRQILKRRANEVADTVAHEAGAFIDEQKGRVVEAFERGRTEVQSFGERAGEAFEHGRAAYRNARERVNAASADVSRGVRQVAEDLGGSRSGD